MDINTCQECKGTTQNDTYCGSCLDKFQEQAHPEMHENISFINQEPSYLMVDKLINEGMEESEAFKWR
jgi:hypothetical protein